VHSIFSRVVQKILADQNNQPNQRVNVMERRDKATFFHYLTYTPKATGASAPSLQEETVVPIH
jgi:hypothetical protein